MFSVVIPLFNKEAHIRCTIKSVLQQTFQFFEIVVVDDGSTDSSAKIISGISDARIRLVKQSNNGVSTARNRGIREASYDYIVFMDADDLWYEDHLARLAKLIEAFPGAGLYTTAYIRKLSSGQIVEKNVIENYLRHELFILPNYFGLCVTGPSPVWTSACCVPKKVFIQESIWFPPNERLGEDLHVWARIAMKYDVAYDKKPSAIYILDSENNTVNAQLEESKPHASILSLVRYRDLITDSEKRRCFDKWVELHVLKYVLRNISNKRTRLALSQCRAFRFSYGSWLKIVVALVVPRVVYEKLIRIKAHFSNAKAIN